MEIANVMLALIFLGSLLLLVGFLYFFFIGPLKKTEPQIISLKKPIKMIGISKRTGLKTIFKDAVELGKEYKSIKDQGLIKNKMEPWAFVAISKDFIGQDSWEYLMGDVVNNLDTVPANLKSFEIPATMYAVFNIKPPAGAELHSVPLIKSESASCLGLKIRASKGNEEIYLYSLVAKINL